MNTNTINIRPAVPEDVVKIAQVEEKCFPPAEAASLKSFLERFMAFPECFWVAETKEDGKVIGHVNGCITSYPRIIDALYHNTALHEPDGPWQAVFGIAVLPEFQRRKIASALMNQLKKDAKERGRKGIILTCKEEKLGFYEGLGFKNEGVSESVHGGAKWYDMVLEF